MSCNCMKQGNVRGYELLGGERKCEKTVIVDG